MPWNGPPKYPPPNPPAPPPPPPKGYNRPRPDDDEPKDDSTINTLASLFLLGSMLSDSEHPQ